MSSTSVTPPQMCAYSKPVPGFLTSYVVIPLFVLGELRREMVVDIGGIVN